MQKLYEFRQNLFGSHKRNVILTASEIKEQLDPEIDSYVGLFHYNSDILEHVKEHNSVFGFTGLVGADKIVFDVDSVVDLELARADALDVIYTLNQNYNIQLDEISIFFSGKKGFSVEFLTKGIEALDKVLSEQTPVLMKRFCAKVAENLETFDTTIYQHNRLFRVPNTRHYDEIEVFGKPTRLFKTNISYEMLQSSPIKSILEYAAYPTETISCSPIKDTSKLNEVFTKLKSDIDLKIKQLPVVGNFKSSSEINLSKAPPYTKLCIWKLSQGVFTNQRDNALFAIADDEQKKGMPTEVIRGKLHGVLDLMNQNNPEKAAIDPVTDADIDRIIRQTTKGAYDLGCFSQILSDVCEPSCYLAHIKFEESKAGLTSVSEAYLGAKTFFKNYNENLITTGFKTIDSTVPFFIKTFNIIAGAPGAAKTSIAFNMLRNLADNDIPTLFLSMDMGIEMAIQRLATVLYPDAISGTDFMKAASEGNLDLISKFDNMFAEFNQHIKISDKRGLSVVDIRKEIETQEKTWGLKPKVVIIDYVQLISSTKNGHEHHSSNAEYLTQLAKEKQICIIGLSQASQFEDKRTGNFSAKGSKGWEEQATVQLNCFRPFQHDEEERDNVLSLKVLKNRLGTTSTIHLYFDGASGHIRDLSSEELFEVKGRMRDMLEKRKKERQKRYE
ncbi:MAG: hypothetical protein KDB74_06590 [Flavobacteriales bacterium]|nr:hypothetical protein [Flavobacteriales bacterium]